MWDAFSPHLAEGESEDSIFDAPIQRVSDLICAGASPPSFTTIPKIDPDSVDRKKRNARLEFEPEAERVYASEHTPMLNEEHRHAFEAIVADVVGGVQSTHFVDGPGGSGETFLYNVLISEIRGKGLSAAAVASSGIAALLLSGGRTAHSKFKLPIRVADESVCAVQKGSVAAEFFNGISLIIWGEEPMAHRHLAECIDRSIRDIRSDDRPFGGVVVAFGGDFRKIPPVVRHGSRSQVVSASLKRSPLWRRMQPRALSRNMRPSEGEEDLARYLIRLGDGLEAVVEGEDKIELPAEMCADATKMADATDEIGGGFPRSR